MISNRYRTAFHLSRILNRVGSTLWKTCTRLVVSLVRCSPPPFWLPFLAVSPSFLSETTFLFRSLVPRPFRICFHHIRSCPFPSDRSNISSLIRSADLLSSGITLSTQEQADRWEHSHCHRKDFGRELGTMGTPTWGTLDDESGRYQTP